MLDITQGKILRALKVVIYGPEGIGKTSLAAKFPDPLIIDTEDGTALMDVRRINKPQSWKSLLAIITEVASTPGICKTLVIDTADWAEQLMSMHLCRKYKKNSIEEFGYGKGYTYMAEEFAQLLVACDLVIAAGINVVFTAHAKMRKYEQPDEMGAYDRWEMKLSKQTAPLLKEWSDMLLFCNYQTFVTTSENNTKKVQGGKRVIYTTHHPVWDAKSRIELPEVIDLDYSSIAFAFEQPKKAAKKATMAKAEPAPEPSEAEPSVYDRFQELLGESGYTEAEVRKVVSDKGHYSYDTPVAEYSEKFMTGWIFKYWPQIAKIIDKNRTAKD